MLVKQKYNIEIGELVLEGFSYLEGKHVGEVLEQELARLITENSIDLGVKTTSIKVLSLNVNKGENPQALGVEVARSIYGGLNKRVKQ
jgi:hypothetical protein